jgi:hypothetical protein
VATRLGEEKVVSVDIFRERILLRGVEGESRLVTLSEFKLETEQPGSPELAATTESDEEELAGEMIDADEISPELMYTAEHQIPASDTTAVTEPVANVAATQRDSDSAVRRRRGRRGGRRGRGEDSQSGNK